MYELKKKVFHEILALAGRVFIVAHHSDGVVIGNRGFTDDEKRNGIILVFNERMNFSWDDGGLQATLVFGTTPEKCYIPLRDIGVIYSPELQAQLITVTTAQEEGLSVPEEPSSGDRPEERDASTVVRVDFRNKKPRRDKGKR